MGSVVRDVVRVTIPEEMCPLIRRRAHQWDRTFTETCVGLIKLGLQMEEDLALTEEADTKWKLRPEAERLG